MIEIRRAAASDHTALSAIRRSAILQLAVPVMSPSQARRWADQAAADRVTRAISQHAVWVAVRESPIGWVEVDGDRVAALYVEPGSCGQGIGSRLLRHAEAAIRDGGYAVARLETSAHAVAFYSNRGYVPSGVRNADGALAMSKRVEGARVAIMR